MLFLPEETPKTSWCFFKSASINKTRIYWQCYLLLFAYFLVSALNKWKRKWINMNSIVWLLYTLNNAEKDKVFEL